MSIRKPLVRFDSSAKAHLISTLPFQSPSDFEKEETEETPIAKKPKKSFSSTGKAFKSKTRRTNKTKSKKQTSNPVISKGQLLLKVPGFQGSQKVQLSKLVTYLPRKVLNQAAKRVLIASGVKVLRKKKKRRSQANRTTLFGDG